MQLKGNKPDYIKIGITVISVLLTHREFLEINFAKSTNKHLNECFQEKLRTIIFNNLRFFN